MRRFTFSLSLSCARDRHVERDLSALSRLARNLHLTAVKQRNALHDRQSQASAAGSLGTRRIDAEEAIKNPRQRFRWNADAGVGDFDANRGRIGVRAPTPQFRRAACVPRRSRPGYPLPSARECGPVRQ